ncbi:MAG TPA: NUDIX domain-containing protein [Candidatus Tumulicola sp.]|jgi:8-oxo-dGTP pyrophosphatase MutT (NUDIX family)
MTRIHLATGVLIREVAEIRRVLLVASTYVDRPDPLWNLPGGRQQPGELLPQTAVRELFEETGLRARADGLAYVSESYDGETHFLNAAFCMTLIDDADAGRATAPHGTDHVSDVAWVAVEDLPARIVVEVVREPLLAYLRGALATRYAGYPEAGITIKWPTSSD